MEYHNSIDGNFAGMDEARVFLVDGAAAGLWVHVGGKAPGGQSTKRRDVGVCDVLEALVLVALVQRLVDVLSAVGMALAELLRAGMRWCQLVVLRQIV